MQKIIIPRSIEQFKSTLEYVDAYLIGISDLCISNGLNINIGVLSDIIDLCKDKEIYININKNIENKELINLKDILLKLNHYHIKGVFYYDVAILNMSLEMDLNYDLIWASEHATTNYDTINYWNSFGVNGALLSSDITVREVMDIKKNTHCKLIVPIFGYQQMFVSKRNLVNNYLKQFSLIDNSNINYIKKEGKIYPIVDNKLGTEVYTNYILNGICEYFNFVDNNIDYVLLDSFNLDDNEFVEVLKIVHNLKRDNVLKSYEQINSMFDNVDTGFLYKETIARVKKNEK